MTKRCEICGQPFEASNSRRKTCGDIDCQRIRHAEYLKEYMRKRRATQRDQVNDYNRKWMREYRAKLKAEDKERSEKANSFTADGYAERQKAKTLQMAGRVSV